jgi:hypothetical protein
LKPSTELWGSRREIPDNIDTEVERTKEACDDRCGTLVPTGNSCSSICARGNYAIFDESNRVIGGETQQPVELGEDTPGKTPQGRYPRDEGHVGL